jgi:hypothetical protein
MLSVENQRTTVPAKNAVVALLLIDVINNLEFEGGEDLLSFALPMATHISARKQRAKGAGIPIINVNDNFGKWRLDFRKLVHHCLEDGVREEPVVKFFRPDDEPDDEDYFGVCEVTWC